MRSARSVVSVAVLAMGVSGSILGCASSAAQREGADPISGVPGGALLAVANNSIFDVRVYVLRAGQRLRLGLVTSGATTTFELGRLVIDREIALYAEPVGGRGQQRTETIYVQPGQEVRLELEKRLRSHTLSIH